MVYACTNNLPTLLDVLISQSNYKYSVRLLSSDLESVVVKRRSSIEISDTDFRHSPTPNDGSDGGCSKLPERGVTNADAETESSDDDDLPTYFQSAEK